MRYYHQACIILIISSLCAGEIKWGNPPTSSAKATKSSIKLNNNELGPLYNFKILNGSRALYDSNDGLETITTRQIPNASSLYEKNVKSVVLVGAGSGLGAGVIVGNYEIVTNYHVVEGFAEVDIVLFDPNVSSLKQIDDNKIYKAEVFAVDDKRDLAFLKTNRYLYYPTTFGKNWKIKIASDVFAIGHPSGLWSFTYGVISSLPNPKEWTYDGENIFSANCIQTQTPINPGNSGGPLFNDKGEVIGINSYTSEGEGLNFAVRVDEVNDFIKGARNGEYPKGEKIAEIPWDLIPDHGYEDIHEVYGQDSNADGVYDIWLIYEDEDDILDVRLFDVNYDGDIDIIHAIAEGEFMLDTDYDGEFDTLGIDTNNDWKPDKFEDYIE